jgi:predicted acetyltransferase
VEIAELTIRALTADDAPAFNQVLSRAFLNDDGSPHWVELHRAELGHGRGVGVFDDDRMVGSGIILTRSITLPGGDVVPFAGISCIAVASDHRRRGALRKIMRAQLHGLHAHGAEPFAVLWASESRIYRRFGYGEASEYTAVELTKGADFRPGIELSTDPIREVPAEVARPLMEEIYAKLLPNRVGKLSRSSGDWDHLMADDPAERDGMSSRRFAVHPEGYACYRVGGGRGDRGPSGRLHVEEIVATTPQAHALLWRYVLDMDLIGTITGRIGPDDPVRQMLAEPMAQLLRQSPALWVRIVDLDRALVARRYLTPLDVVFEVTDEFCPWNAGRWRLTADETGAAQVTRTQDEPDIALDIIDLGAAFLGGTRLNTLAATGRVRELTDGAVRRASAAFLGENLPDTIEVF